ncbi:MAG: hypothetical protein ABH843_04950 [Candidatus Omnitrophota bacterium]
MTLKRFCNSDLHKKIIIFFKDNPASVDSPRGVAAWTGLSRTKVKKALDELVQAGILSSISVSSASGYSFTQDQRIIEEIMKYLKEE